MKKCILSFFAFFAFFITQAQNLELLKKANNCTLDVTRTIADEIVLDIKTKFVYLKSVEANYLHKIVFVYIKEGLSDDKKKSIEAYISQYTGRYELQLEDCICVHFWAENVGANPDLEIAGTKKYFFDSVKGKFLDLFPFYQKNVDPTATVENTTTTGSYAVRKNDAGYWYTFIRSSSDSLWLLQNRSYRLNQ